MMDLAQLANLGEFIGGVAVLVTLIHLAVQMKGNVQSERAESHRSFVQDFDGPSRALDVFWIYNIWA